MTQGTTERPELVLVGAHVRAPIRERLQALAAREEVSVAAVVRRALRAELDRADTDGEES